MRRLHDLARQRSLRISRHEWALGLAVTTAKRGTCLRRQVGCVLMDQDGFVLATGYNGVAAGQPHCNEPAKDYVDQLRVVDTAENEAKKIFPHACPASFAESGTQLDGCHAVHAEMNALLRCGDPRAVHACYTTHSPCITCVKLLMNTGCQTVFFLEPYAHDQAARELWQASRGPGAWIHATADDLREYQRLGL